MRGWICFAALTGCSGDIFSKNERTGCLEDQISIEGGTYVIGEEHPTQPWHQPAQEVELSPFCIDQYEYSDSPGGMPKADVTWDEAKASCEAIGKRLCTSYEWERACRGPERQRYSYGNERDAQKCNTPISGPGPGSKPAPIRPSGSYSECQSAEGVFDLNGSLSEWVSDPWTGQPEPFNPSETVNAETWRTLRGGTMWDKTFYGQDCTSRHGHQRSFKNMDDGFRCCRDG